MTGLLLIALLILAPTTVFAQTAASASGLQPTSGAKVFLRCSGIA